MQASSGLTAWTAHLLLLKLVLWLLGVPSAVPLLEAVCYTGYPLVLVNINTIVVALLGKQAILNSLALACEIHAHTKAYTTWAMCVTAHAVCSGLCLYCTVLQ